MGRPMAETARKLTHADFLLIPDDGQRHELIDGEHFVTPTPIVRHQLVVGNLHYLFESWVRQHRQGLVVLSPMDVILSDHDVVEPDLIYLRAERTGLATADWVRGAPDLLVEVLSPSTRRHDEVRKRDLYERFAVEEYWLVDPEAETVKVYRSEGGRYGRPRLLSRRDGDRVASPLLPGFDAGLEEAFARLG